MENNTIQTTTQLFESLVKTLNNSTVPFDAKVFVVRSFHQEVENEYAKVKKSFLDFQEEKGKEE